MWDNPIHAENCKLLEKKMIIIPTHKNRQNRSRLMVRERPPSRMETKKKLWHRLCLKMMKLNQPNSNNKRMKMMMSNNSNLR